MIQRFLSKTAKFSNKKLPSINQIKQCWSDYSQGYNKFDYSPQTFYYSFLYMTHIWKANNILEVACGTGKLLPIALQLKRSQAKYLATDLSPSMIELTKKNLNNNFQKYQSKITFEQWQKRMNFQVKVANGQEKILEDNQQKFDRIICNCVLMLTADAQKMLTNLYNEAAPGCLMAVSVWGDKDKNNFMTTMRNSIIQAGFQLPPQRSNFYLYRKVQALAQKCGWQIVLNWQQNVLFPVLNMDDKENQFLFFHQVNKLPQQQQIKVKQILLKKLHKQMQEKRGFNFSCQMLILKKK